MLGDACGRHVSALAPLLTNNLLYMGFRKVPIQRVPPPRAVLRRVLAESDFAALLESGPGWPERARYTIVAWGVKRVFRFEHGDKDLEKGLKSFWRSLKGGATPFGEEPAIGFLSYEAVAKFEPFLANYLRFGRWPLAEFVVPENAVIYDNLLGRAYVLGEPPKEGGEAGNYSVEGPSAYTPRDDYVSWVSEALERIRAGEIFQVVLSRWEEYYVYGDVVTLYEALANLNPSPYMYLLKTGEFTILGTSPELLVKVDGDRVETHPIAGTRPRGSTPEEDLALEEELLSSVKDRAEHIMLVDLARNDLGRVCRPGTVRVTELFAVEKYSHVQHLVSKVEGVLERGLTPVDALAATFPAGTVTGAPKPRAMEIIAELEREPRGPFAGALGVMWRHGLETAIIIRSMFGVGRRFRIQAGAGIVHDSTPEGEWAETESKLAAIKRVLRG